MIVAIALVGCAGDRQSDPQSTAPQTIRGVNRVVHWDVAGASTSVGESPIGVFIEAQLADGSREPARVSDDGTFSIDATPAGPYWLRFVNGKHSREDVYLFSDATELDLGRDVVGNDGGLATSLDTQLVVDAGGLSPWQDGDDGDFVIPELGYRSSIITFFSANTPITGDTSLADLTYFWLQQPLPASSQGDDTIFVQVRPAHDDALGLDYDAPVRTFQSAPIAIADADTARISGTFADPPAFDVPLHWARTGFAAQAPAMHPPTCTDELDNEIYWVHAMPGHGARGELSRSFLDPEFGIPDNGPRVVDDVFTLDTTDLSGTLHVTNPYPADWLYARYAISYAISCPVPGAGVPGNAEAEIGVVSSDLSTTITPLVGPVSAPTIGGHDLSQVQTGVGTEPTISWTAPAIGTATAFELHISEVDLSQFGGLMLHEDVELIVPGDVTTIMVPQGVLAAGTAYQIRIRAISRTGQDPRTAPFRSGMPLGYADLFTNYFEP